MKTESTVHLRAKKNYAHTLLLMTSISIPYSIYKNLFKVYYSITLWSIKKYNKIVQESNTNHDMALPVPEDLAMTMLTE